MTSRARKIFDLFYLNFRNKIRSISVFAQSSHVSDNVANAAYTCAEKMSFAGRLGGNPFGRRTLRGLTQT
jgi:hypothetical protein